MIRKAIRRLSAPLLQYISYEHRLSVGRRRDRHLIPRIAAWRRSREALVRSPCMTPSIGFPGGLLPRFHVCANVVQV